MQQLGQIAWKTRVLVDYGPVKNQKRKRQESQDIHKGLFSVRALRLSFADSKPSASSDRSRDIWLPLAFLSLTVCLLVPSPLPTTESQIPRPVQSSAHTLGMEKGEEIGVHHGALSNDEGQR